jgi:ribosome-associated protein
MQDQDNDDGLGGRSRDRREFAEGNQRWARRLADLPDEVAVKAPLPEVVRDELVLARRLDANAERAGRARNRSLRRIDMLISGLEPEEIAAIDRFLDAPPLDADDPRIEAWYDRLLDAGDDAVGALAEAFPAADLQQLRQILRNTKKPALRERAQRQLREWLITL